ncbi:MAG: TetR/AcrR family transcriptional regulator [Acidimicrobiia bacterium]|nr:TetR/AcrR family transcriptional regulator [Acidimicrobiia bacterium]
MTLQSNDEPVKRTYHSPRREAQADETRLAIIGAALELFAAKGFQGTTIKQVAEQAGVSEQTIYNVFADKTGLLVGVGLHSMTSGDDGSEAFVADLLAEPDPMERIRMTARFSKEQWTDGALELDRMLFGPDVKDPRLEELAERLLAFKLGLNRAIAEMLFPDSIRRADVSLDEIAAFATTVDSGPSITTLRRLGWSMDDYEGWITRLLSLFLDPSAVEG